MADPLTLLIVMPLVGAAMAAALGWWSIRFIGWLERREARRQ
jgi:hypothetical protein